MAEPYFADRADAGRRLAASLAAFHHVGAAVLGIPRGGVEVAAEVARALDADLDIVVAKKIGAPGQQELAIGAVTADGGRYLNDRLIDSIGVSMSYLESATAVLARDVAERAVRLRGGRSPVVLANRVVIIVDDGLATGATAIAAVRSVKRQGAARVIVAVPVGSDQACDSLRAEAEVVCPNELSSLVAIGYYYRNFEAVDDSRVIELLTTAQRPPAATGP